MKAEWPLKVSGPEELLLTAHALQEKIKAADLAGLKETKPLTPQEEELAEERAIFGSMGAEMTGEPKRGEPMFVYVARIQEAERAKALSEAFQKAKAEAGRLARAAGTGLGPLRQLHHLQPPSGEPDYFGSYGGYPYQVLQRVRALVASDSDSAASEAVGTQPGKVTLRLTVTAAFALQAPK